MGIIKKTVKKKGGNRGTLTVIGGPMFAGKTTKLLTLFSVLSKLGFSLLVFKAEATTLGGMGHTRSHDERPLPVIYIQMGSPKKILQYVGNEGIEKVIIDAVHFFPKKDILAVIDELLSNGIDVYANGLVYDYKRHEYGATKTLMGIADETIELFSVCVKCGGKAMHSERVSGATATSIGTTGKIKATYQPVCGKCHKTYRG